MNATRNAVVVLLAALACSCAGTSPTADSDAALRSRLIGQWQELRIFERELHQHFITLNRDGTFEVNGVLHEPEKATPFTWRGTWRLKGRKFIYTTTFSKPEGMFQPGETLEDTVDYVSDEEWVMIEQSTGGTSRAYRVR